MSVLFKSLQKLKAQAKENRPDEKRRLWRKEKKRIKKTLFFSFIPVVSISVFLFAAIGTLYGYHNYRPVPEKPKSYPVSSTTAFLSKNNPLSGRPGKPPDYDDDRSVFPERQAVVDVQTGRLDRDGTDHQAVLSGEKANHTPAGRAEKKNDRLNAASIREEHKRTSNGSNHRRPLPFNDRPDTVLSSSGSVNPPAGSEDLSRYAGVETTGLQEDKAGPATDKKDRFAGRAEKRMKISRLIEQITWAMDQENSRQVEDLIGRLSGLKGKENTYVLKLKAFWLMRNQKYEQAAVLLQQVLAKDGLDLEAGINMAILEVKTDRRQKAYKRLTELNKRYPENGRITTIMNQLNL